MSHTRETLHQDTDRKATNQAGGRFAMIPTCIVPEIDTAGAWRVYVALASYAGGDRTAYPKQATLAGLAGYKSARSVQRHLRHLEQLGVVRTSRPHRSGPLLYEMVDPCGKCFNQTRPDDVTSTTDMRDVTSTTDMHVATKEQSSYQRIEVGGARAPRRTEPHDPVEAEAYAIAEKEAAERKGTPRAIDDIGKYAGAILRKDRDKLEKRITKRQEQEQVNRDKTECGQCDDNGKRWENINGETVTYDSIDATTAYPCHHAATNPQRVAHLEEPLPTGSPPTVDQLTAAIVESATIPGPEPGTAEWRQIQDTLPL